MQCTDKAATERANNALVCYLLSDIPAFTCSISSVNLHMPSVRFSQVVESHKPYSTLKFLVRPF